MEVPVQGTAGPLQYAFCSVTGEQQGRVWGCVGMLGLPPVEVMFGGHFASHGSGFSPNL